jgi:hypothetical protein
MPCFNIIPYASCHNKNLPVAICLGNCFNDIPFSSCNFKHVDICVGDCYYDIPFASCHLTNVAIYVGNCCNYTPFPSCRNTVCECNCKNDIQLNPVTLTLIHKAGRPKELKNMLDLSGNLDIFFEKLHTFLC